MAVGVWMRSAAPRQKKKKENKQKQSFIENKNMVTGNCISFS